MSCVFVGKETEAFNISGYTMGVAAKSLGKTVLTFKSWVKKGLIPPPIFLTEERRWPAYHRHEIEIICEVLAKHEKEYSYLVEDTPMVAEIKTRITKWRES
jgi:hypothetical protein